MWMVLMLFVVFGLPWWLAAGSLLIRRNDRRSSKGKIRLLLACVRGAGLVTLAVLPVAIVQPWFPHSTDFNLDTQLWMPLVVPGIHAGGWTVTALFEPLAESGVFGHRQTTMLSNWPVFFALALVQTLVVGAAIGARLLARDAKRRVGARLNRFDPFIIAVMVACTLNAALNITWHWWGS